MVRSSTDENQNKSSGLDYQEAIKQVSQSAVLLLDASCRVTSWNSGGQNLTGYAAKEVIGQPFFKFYPEKDQSEGKPMAILRQAVRKGSVIEKGWRVKKDGTKFWAHIVTTALYDEQKKVIGFIKIVNNYGENKHLDNQRLSLLQTTQILKKTVAVQKVEIKLLKKRLKQQAEINQKPKTSL
jgi:PAS domain S-box-containing protein